MQEISQVASASSNPQAEASGQDGGAKKKPFSSFRPKVRSRTRKPDKVSAEQTTLVDIGSSKVVAQSIEEVNAVNSENEENAADAQEETMYRSRIMDTSINIEIPVRKKKKRQVTFQNPSAVSERVSHDNDSMETQLVVNVHNSNQNINSKYESHDFNIVASTSSDIPSNLKERRKQLLKKAGASKGMKSRTQVIRQVMTGRESGRASTNNKLSTGMVPVHKLSKKKNRKGIEGKQSTSLGNDNNKDSAVVGATVTLTRGSNDNNSISIQVEKDNGNATQVSNDTALIQFDAGGEGDGNIRTTMALKDLIRKNLKIERDELRRVNKQVAKGSGDKEENKILITGNDSEKGAINGSTVETLPAQPQVEVVDGQIVINKSTLQVVTTGEEGGTDHKDTENGTKPTTYYKRVEESGPGSSRLNSMSYSYRERTMRWSEEETDLFYKVRWTIIISLRCLETRTFFRLQ